MCIYGFNDQNELKLNFLNPYKSLLVYSTRAYPQNLPPKRICMFKITEFLANDSPFAMNSPSVKTVFFVFGLEDAAPMIQPSSQQTANTSAVFIMNYNIVFTIATTFVCKLMKSRHGNYLLAYQTQYFAQLK